MTVEVPFVVVFQLLPFVSGNAPAHLAAQEGHLPCLKYLIASAPSVEHVLSARNDQGETPKDLANRFYKKSVVEFIDNIEYEKEHAEEEESMWPFFLFEWCAGS